MAAAPESFILQHKHPFASSKTSSVCSVGSLAEETLIVLASLMFRWISIEFIDLQDEPSMSYAWRDAFYWKCTIVK